MELKDKTNDQICSFVGSRIRSERNRLAHSQEEFASLVGIPLRTYKRIELTGKGTVENLVNILRFTERLRIMEFMFPQPAAHKQTLEERIQLIAERRKIRR